jgi:hypothetical protein
LAQALAWGIELSSGWAAVDAGFEGPADVT